MQSEIGLLSFGSLLLLLCVISAQVPDLFGNNISAENPAVLIVDPDVNSLIS